MSSSARFTGPSTDRRDSDPVAITEARLDRLPSRALARCLFVCGTLLLVPSLALTVDWVRLQSNPDAALACDLSPFFSCSRAMTEGYGAVLFGIPNSVFGIVGGVLFALFGVALFVRLRPSMLVYRGLLAAVWLSGVTITVFQAETLFVVGALCPWCTLVWAITIPLVVVVTGQLLSGGVLGDRAVPAGSWVRARTVEIVTVWYVLVVVAVGLRFGAELVLWLSAD